MDADFYTQGIKIDASKIFDYTNKSEPVSECNKISRLLNGGLLVTLDIAKDTKPQDIKKSIEKASELLPSFKPLRHAAICAECGFKDEPFADKCPKCKSPHTV